MKIAFFTPVSPIQSALADYGEGLALALHNQPSVTVDLFIDTGYQPTDPVVQSELSSHPYHRYPDLRADYDVTLYSMGDNGRY
ncbi:MAG: hypothetical protein GY943_18600, partial [Chloroflexi bacterium]|nr:hypothetical protein [Chloroflexota bacterium]